MRGDMLSDMLIDARSTMLGAVRNGRQPSARICPHEPTAAARGAPPIALR